MQRIDRNEQRKRSRTVRLPLKLLRSRTKISKGGFTLLEAIAVLVILAILCAIMAPSFLAWLNTQRLNSAQNQIETVFRQAQNMAKQQRLDYQVSFRQQDREVQWAINQAGANLEPYHWHSLNQGVRILESETTLPKSGQVYKMIFNHYGEVNRVLSGRLSGRVTLESASGGPQKRCVFVSNLLGTTRLGQNRPKTKGNPCE